MKKHLVICFLAIGTAQAQTGLIAHKSHSGTAATFALADPGNFGGPAVMPKMVEKLEKVTWLNDTTVVMSGKMVFGYFMETYQNQGAAIEEENSAYMDTIYNHPVFSDPNMPVDTMAKMYNYDVKFENFDKKVIAPVKENQEQRKNTDAKKGKKPVNNNPTTAQPKKKKSNLFWLWIVGGGTFAGILLVSGRKKQPHYA